MKIQFIFHPHRFPKFKKYHLIKIVMYACGRIKIVNYNMCIWTAQGNTITVYKEWKFLNTGSEYYLDKFIDGVIHYEEYHAKNTFKGWN